MKKVITFTCLALSAVIVLDSFNVWHAAVMFYLAGEIPGTNTSLNPNTMLGLFALLFGFVLARLGNRLTLSLAQRFTLKRSTQS